MKTQLTPIVWLERRDITPKWIEMTKNKNIDVTGRYIDE